MRQHLPSATFAITAGGSRFNLDKIMGHGSWVMDGMMY